MLLVTPLDGEVVVRGALLEPKPYILKGKLPAAGGLEEALSRGMASLMLSGREVSVEEAGRALRDISASAR